MESYGQTGKKEVKKVQVWVKIHDIPIAAYTEDGLSMIATTIGEPKLLDSYTTSMCMDMWGCSSYARALIEVSADKELREEITLAIPEPDGEGFVKVTMHVEYEWYPHRCSKCCVFGHSDDLCPKQPKKSFYVKGVDQKNKQSVQVNRLDKKYPEIDGDGYQGVKSKKVARKTGFQVNKQKQKFEYRPVVSKPKGEMNRGSTLNTIETSNPFDVLDDADMGGMDDKKEPEDDQHESDNEDVVEISNEMDDFILKDSKKPNEKKGQALLLQRFLMVSLASWNIRGLNRPLKQKEVRQIVKDSNLSLCAILESHVDVDKLGGVCKSVFRSWDWTSNGTCCDKGTRIIVGWNPKIFDVMVLSQSSQVMHLQLFFKLDRRTVFCSIVYAANYYVTRRELWHQLSMHKVFVGNNPWCIMGDFNSALNLEDKSMGSSSVSTGMKDFQACVDNLEMFDINRSGFHFTWSQKPKEGVRLLKKSDRVLGNTPFVTTFPSSVVIFHPYRISDHCPCILKIPEVGMLKPRSFEFANFLVYKPEFMEIVKKTWESRVDGVY
ncbi:uncharacterized protein LOC110875674 [Helianthus annuus]|uniref:uncharacterized protein LOC110875674 n=1 Tax=Helianthus annuus TaxID=4232 RepID=UPI000B9071C8|nr:uncharacterized protein LOC110875674 [Helianthus annuus]